MLSNKLTMMISSCNKFSDLWESHAKLLKENWGDRDIETFLLTDSAPVIDFETVEIFPAGKGLEFSERIKALLPYIKTEFILITLDDYFPIKKVSSKKLERLINIMEVEKVDYIRLFKDPNTHEKFKEYKKLYEISLERNYEVNLYQGIWRKSFLEKTVQEPLNAWEYEVSLTKTAKRINAKCLLSKGKEFEILDVVRKGKLLHKAKRYLDKHNIYSGNREVISYLEEFRIQVFSIGKKILPKPIARFVKFILIKMGHEFYSKSI